MYFTFENGLTICFHKEKRKTSNDTYKTAARARVRVHAFAGVTNTGKFNSEPKVLNLFFFEQPVRFVNFGDHVGYYDSHFITLHSYIYFTYFNKIHATY